MREQDVLTFWFEELDSKEHFVGSDVLDAKIKESFVGVYWQALSGETEHWRDTPEGRLAEIIVLDQFARNIFRGSAQAFAGDAVALILAQEAVRAGADADLPENMRPFLYMPYMHSESLLVHDEAMKLFKDFPQNYEFEKKHRDIIEQFGRYPHRNEVLGRESTPEEIEFMKKNKGF